MMNLKLKIFVFLLCFFVLSCKTKQIVLQKPITENKEAANIAFKTIEQFYQTAPNFKTAYIKADIDYKDNRRAQSVTADIRIEKDKNILVSVKLFGITLAKALITPDRVQYYEKLGGKFFDGNYATISQWLGTDLDFQKIQNLILGQPFVDLSKIKCEQNIVDENILLRPKQKLDIDSQFLFKQNPVLLVKQIVSQIVENRKVEVTYQNHELNSNGIYPRSIDIIATQNTNTTSVKVEITKITLNEDLSFKYNVPEGYGKLEIKQ
ncbi:MAG: hypothetical protein RLZZ312_38 [Bacteroidota bacterium]|jgi:hypothetical protein